eukprot:CAMPEP_0197596060 /NCGR_PEP_ID=MMETSP1326-20131121/24259_1 /TAXON_ID=1155430 /ORGANISM="Genus nov. species nov., Strain RCC2288" /LENGTH=41 /DNA_ID= /DNA_START= /DNA_END= /DNA_ORIENTATION=
MATNADVAVSAVAPSPFRTVLKPGGAKPSPPMSASQAPHLP